MKTTAVWKSHSILAIAVVLLAASLAQAQRPQLIRLYRDESRALPLGSPVWTTLHRSAGYHVTVGMDLLDYGRLKCCDVIIVWNSVETISYDPVELDAVTRFVQEGGGLLLVGNPALSRPTTARASFLKGRFRNLQKLPDSSFSMNQLSGLYDVRFANGMRPGEPIYQTTTEPNHGINVSLLQARQPLAPLICNNASVQTLVEAHGGPAVVAVEHGAGRVIICSASRLLMKQGSLAERKLGKTDTVLGAQKKLVDGWLRWLAARRFSTIAKEPPLPGRVLPRVEKELDNAVFYYIPQVEPRATEILADWDRIWADFSDYTGLESPMACAPGDLRRHKMEVYIRPAMGGGYAGAREVALAAFGDEWRATAVLGHEVGHKLLGAPTSSMSEGFAQWMNFRGLRATGRTVVADERLQQALAEYRRADPTGRELDLADGMTDITKSKACQGKWLWVLLELEKNHGDDFIRRYVKSLRAGVPLDGSHHKRVGTKRVKVTMEDLVFHMSQAAGLDLAPWFRDLGITVGFRSVQRP